MDLTRCFSFGQIDAYFIKNILSNWSGLFLFIYNF